MGTACACAPLIPRASSDSRPSAHCPSPGAGLDAPRQRPQHPVHDDVGREENGQADVCLRLTDHRRTAEYELKVVTLGLIGDVLRRRGLRFPPDDWGTTSVIWRKGTFRAPNAVPDSVRRPLPAGESLHVVAIPARLAWLAVRVEGRANPGFSTKIHQEALPQRPATGLPGPGRLLHEPRAVLAGVCAYCTNPRTPRSTPTPRPVGPDPRALRPGEVGTPPVSDLARARANPRQRFSYRGFE